MKNSFKVFNIIFKDRFYTVALNALFQYVLYTLFLLFLVFFYNVNDYLVKVGSKVTFYAFFKKDIANENIVKLKKIIENWPEVKSVKIIKPEEGIAILKRSLGKESGILNTLDTNPLPVTLQINIKPAFTEKFYINQISDRLKKFEMIEWYDTTEKYIGNIISVRKNMTNIFIGGIALFLFIIFLALRIMSRGFINKYAQSIQLLKMLGASRAFIVIPFIVEGFIESFITSLLSTATSVYVVSYLQSELTELGFTILSLPLEVYLLFMLLVSAIGGISNIPGKKLL